MTHIDVFRTIPIKKLDIVIQIHKILAIKQEINPAQLIKSRELQQLFIIHNQSIKSRQNHRRNWIYKVTFLKKPKQLKQILQIHVVLLYVVNRVEASLKEQIKLPKNYKLNEKNWKFYKERKLMWNNKRKVMVLPQIWPTMPYLYA